MFDSIFSGIVMIDHLHNCVEEICLLHNVCYGNGNKSTVSVNEATVAKRIKYFINFMRA